MTSQGPSSSSKLLWPAMAGVAVVFAVIVVVAWPDFDANRPTPVAVAASHPAPVRIAARSAPAPTAPAKPPQAAAAATPPKPNVDPNAFADEERMSPHERMKRWDDLIAQASKKYGVPAAWIRAVMMAESAGRTMSGPSQPIVSRAGAMGLMQLMPGTYADMRRQLGLGADPFDPHDNVFAGVAYLAQLHAKYGYPTMFAAYNDGPGHLDERLANEQLLPTETIVYVERITGRLEGRLGQVKFTRPDGTPIFVDGAAVRAVRPALAGEYAPGVQSVITVGTVQQGVREDFRTAKMLALARGGSASARTRLVTKLVVSCERRDSNPAQGRITCHPGKS